LLRDRDAVVTPEGIILRVYGYDHPPRAYVCDAEYAHESIYRSGDPRALREGKEGKFYKFYEDEGLKFVARHFPRYTIYYDPLNTKLVGVREGEGEARRTDERLRVLLKEPRDPLVEALRELLDLVLDRSSLSEEDFGIFGSLQHGFHHPAYSDLDLVIYGGKNLDELRKLLREIYLENNGFVKNEFEEAPPIGRWRFINYSVDEYLKHQRRKLIYAVFNSHKLGRMVKVEFEPVKSWDEIVNEYELYGRIVQEGMVTLIARVVDDRGAGYMPSIYLIEVEEVLEGPKAYDVERIVSYVEEFRLQAFKDEKILVKGWLEKVEGKRSFKQITLTRRERYYEQVVKVLEGIDQ